MPNAFDEAKSAHYGAPFLGFGPVKNSERLLFAIIGVNRTGAKLTAADFEDRQLKRAEQSVARYAYTTKRSFSRTVGQLGYNGLGVVTGLSLSVANQLREISFQVKIGTNLEKTGSAICLYDTVTPRDDHGHAAISYSPQIQALSEPEKRKVRPLVRLDLAEAFGDIVGATDFNWSGFEFAVWFNALKAPAYAAYRKLVPLKPAAQ
jgi:hypothetical protein